MSEQYPCIVPPKSQSTTSPSTITRSLGSWWGLAAFAAGGDDGEVGALVAALEHPLDELAVHVELGAAGERARPHRCGDVVDDAAPRAQRVDLVGVLHHPQRTGDVGRAPERDVGQRALQVEDETGPRVVADGRRRRRRRAVDQPGDDARSGSSVSSQGTTSNASGRSTTRGASSRGTTSTASPSTGSTSIVSRSSGIAS